jgi:hypothetical protein
MPGPPYKQSVLKGGAPRLTRSPGWINKSEFQQLPIEFSRARSRAGKPVGVELTQDGPHLSPGDCPRGSGKHFGLVSLDVDLHQVDPMNAPLVNAIVEASDRNRQSVAPWVAEHAWRVVADCRVVQRHFSRVATESAPLDADLRDDVIRNGPAQSVGNVGALLSNRIGSFGIVLARSDKEVPWLSQPNLNVSSKMRRRRS